MSKYGWELQEISTLGSLFARSSTVTPYFYCVSIGLSRGTHYAIHGAVGVIDRDFEDAWAMGEGRHHFPRMLALSLHTSNLVGHDESGYIAIDTDLGVEVDRYCAAISRLLEQMPQSKSELSEALSNGRIARFPLGHFDGGPTMVAKFNAFIAYVQGLR